ncbi:glycosyl hydrolase 5 family protein-like isoform X2 [Prosopis cineraria]|uniref:glycosyl hydrolase 5 family protein-like isoform X2 n=1 Tax=Prosopis cineraria TaxID=364024 RepID=UPI002410A9F4|nr:glycosyl hydrolase 5 family protein-like isoform X2 [Prosopis cineraria]
MSVMLAEGLDKQPIKHIILQLHNLKLNCVRLTWATYMFTRYSNNTVQQTLDSLGLANTKAGITEHNHDVLTMTHPQAYVYVVDQLAAQNIMIISDNHISEPKWCCAPDDGNAFFGDTSFDPKEWLQGLSMAAQLLKDKPNVVVMSLRNELRGPLQNTNSWYGNMTQGAQTVHQGNPNVVVLISGFYNDNDLSFLKDKPLNLTFKDKLAYEVHAYTVSDPSSKEAMSSIFYHPQTGQCMKSRKLGDQVEVNECKRVSGWSLNGTQIKFQSRRKVKCLKANGDGNPVLLTKDCSNTNQTSWKPITESGMHWATVDAQGNQLCLQKDANSSTILTAKCICADSNSSCMDNPQSQWFQFVSSNVK